MTLATSDKRDTGYRFLTTQLAEDITWLEKHAHSQAELAPQALRLRFAAALVRNLIGPFLDGQEATPLHVVTVGGAGAGKSTVANFLAGTMLAESNPQAGFTRHPIAYISANGQINWPAHVGFLGPLRRLTETTPASLDEDVYQVRRVPAASPEIFNLLREFVVWDCPDMTTWAATGYISRLVEVSALADIIIYVASDERYNDEVPTQFLRMLVEAGKALIVCLMKMKEKEVPAFVEHFRQEVLHRFKAENVPIITIPHLTQEELANPIEKAKRFQIPLINQVSVLGSPPQAARRNAVHSAMDYLLVNQDHLLNVAKQDLAALQRWRDLVRQGQVEFDSRYRREFLTTERFHRFDEALVRLLELLELPGIGRYVSMILRFMRMPYNYAKSWLGKVLQRPPTPPVPEKPILDNAMKGWLDMLRTEAARRSENHPLWAHVDNGFESGLYESGLERFEQNFRTFQLSQADEADRTARAIYEQLEKDPVKLNTLRGAKFALEASAITIAVASGWTLSWIDLILAPLAASVTQHLVELLGKSYVDAQRERVRERQQTLMIQYISSPMADWLAQWPTSGGSDYERLQLALKRIPEAIKQVEAAVKKKLID